MNFAWSNPTTGLREQTPQIAFPYRPNELEALRHEAFRRAWQSLQDDPQAPPEVEICEQIRVGSVTQESESIVDLSEIMHAEWNQQDCLFAFSHPVNGLRITAIEWPGYLKEVLAADPIGFISEVAIYASRPAFTIHRTDPAPNAPEPVPGREHPELDDLEAIHREVADFIDLDGGNPAPKATALALIDIARSLRRLLGEFTPPVPPPDWSQMPAMTPFCTCTGDGLIGTGDGYCVCPTGQARRRAAAVAERPAEGNTYYDPVSRSWKWSGTVSKASPDSPQEPASGE
jgi:hypothetical protein